MDQSNPENMLFWSIGAGMVMAAELRAASLSPMATAEEASQLVKQAEFVEDAQKRHAASVVKLRKATNQG